MNDIKRIEVKFNNPQKNYTIDIGEHIEERLISFLEGTSKGKRLLIITDETVASYYLQDLEDSLNNLDVDLHTYIIKPGEESKSLGVASDIYATLASKAFSRSDLIIAFGGGVVGDLAGYVAATYKRGIPFIQVPTTLLSQVDSSVGGKVAVNIKEGKNLVGAFYQPQYVLIDKRYLETLADSQWQDGLGEIIKYAFIGSLPLYKLLREKSLKSIKGVIGEVIAACCQIKRDVVVEDEFDTGLRMILNFGHTLGHAIEKHYGYGRYTHGQAVAMGMYLIMRQYEAFEKKEADLTDQIKEMLEGYDLYKEAICKDYPAYCLDILNDKKIMDNKINIIVVDKVGKAKTYPLTFSQAKRLLTLEIE
jgi:3-dehydroquinate synthase